MLHGLIECIEPGSPKNTVHPPTSRSDLDVTAPVALVTGPWVGPRVLVVGGRHDDAVVARRDIMALGGAVALNLTATVTDVLVLDGAEGDPRCGRARSRGLRMLCRADLGDPVRVAGEVAVPSLPRGAAFDLPRDIDAWTVNVSWRATETASDEVDVVAVLLGPDEQVGSDDDFVFYNQPADETGAVRLSVDGSSEQSVHIHLRLLADECSRVHVGAAVVGGRSFGEVGAIALSIGGHAGTVATAVLDAATTERTLVLAEVYRRNATWRLRIVGQGYDDGLAELAHRHGVTVE